MQFNTNVNQINQEVRLASKPAGPDDRWSWLGGIYYSRSRTGLLDNEYIPGFNSTFESLYHATPLDMLGAAFPNDLVYDAFTEFVNTQEALFGQATYQILPGLKVTAGARYEKATEELSFNSLGYFASGAPYSGSATGYKTTPKGVISYEFGKTMIYASAAEGFRDGGINRPVPIPLCSADLASLGPHPGAAFVQVGLALELRARRQEPPALRPAVRVQVRCSTSAGTTSRPTSSCRPAPSTSRTTSAAPKTAASSSRRPRAPPRT